nr:hypothetical protein CFP56_20551 [Quercus suber]
MDTSLFSVFVSFGPMSNRLTSTKSDRYAIFAALDVLDSRGGSCDVRSRCRLLRAKDVRRTSRCDRRAFRDFAYSQT